MAFYVGQKVVALANWSPFPSAPNTPVKGSIYTIAEIVWYEEYNNTGLRFYELKNPVRFWLNGRTEEACFVASYFRPLVERKTDISIFQRLLIPSNLEREEA